MLSGGWKQHGSEEVDKKVLYSLAGKVLGIGGEDMIEFFSAVEQAEEILKDMNFSAYDDILFISKSVGTAVSAAYAGKHHLKTRNIYYTPVEASFQFMTQPGIAFTGTKDSWVNHEAIKEGCEKGGFPLYVIEDANHSLETGDVMTDLENLQKIMQTTEKYIVCNNPDK